MNLGTCHYLKKTKQYFDCVPHNLLTPCFSDDAQSVELTQFKEQFKSHLTELMKPVSTTATWLTKTILQLCNLQIILKVHAWFFFFFKVSLKIKKHTDEAVWIRIAWGENFSRPNHLKPTYVVHHLQTPYVFVTSLTSKQKPPLFQVRKEFHMFARCFPIPSH